MAQRVAWLEQDVFAECHPETECLTNGTLYLEAVAPIMFVHHIRVLVLIHSSP